MRYLAVILAVLCGICLIAKIATGSIEPGQLAGIGIILLAVAFFLPATFPNLPG